jgi:hypothetical protein
MDTAATGSNTNNRSSFYEIGGAVHYNGRLVEAVRVVKGGPASEAAIGEIMPCDNAEEGDRIVGTMARQLIDQSRWTMLPHLALANLPSYDASGMFKLRLDDSVLPIVWDLSPTELAARKPELTIDAKAVQKFVQTYGLLSVEDLREVRAAVPGGALDLGFQEKLSSFASAQELLRRAWGGDRSVVDINLKTEIDFGFELRALEIIRPRAEALLETEDLWKFICFLFLVDDAKGRTGLCANPGCPAPYFLKKRITQKFCELGPCTAFAQRKYALEWWHDKGKLKQRERRRPGGKKSRSRRRDARSRKSPRSKDKRR